MLAPIPFVLLTDTATINVCTGVDIWDVPTWQSYTVSHVHLQNTNETKKAQDNTEVVLRSVLFIDAQTSLPWLNFEELAQQSQSAGKPMTCTVMTGSCEGLGPFRVLPVDAIPNVPAYDLHHVELGVV